MNSKNQRSTSFEIHDLEAMEILEILELMPAEDTPVPFPIFELFCLDTQEKIIADRFKSLSAIFVKVSPYYIFIHFTIAFLVSSVMILGPVT